MSLYLNRVFLMGHLTRDPEVRFLASGKAVGQLGLAMSKRYKTKDGVEKEEVCFVDITVWGRRAEVCADYLQKGSAVHIEGKLTLDQWESKGGEKRSKIKVTADGVTFLSPQRKSENKNAEPEEGASDNVPPPGKEPEGDDYSGSLPF